MSDLCRSLHARVAADVIARYGAAVDDLAACLDRVVSMLRTMSAGKLGTRLSGPVETRADAGRLLAAVLARACQGIEDAGAPASPAWRVVPRLADLAIGDQVSVLAHDLARATAGASGDVWTPDGRAPLSDVLRDVAATADEVRRLLA